MQLGRFSGFEYDSEGSMSLLQYADDTLLVGKATFDNLWALKAVLRSFEVVPV